MFARGGDVQGVALRNRKEVRQWRAVSAMVRSLDFILIVKESH